MSSKLVKHLSTMDQAMPLFVRRVLENGPEIPSKLRIDMQPSCSIQVEQSIDKSGLTLPALDDPQAQRATALQEIMRAITISLDVATSFAGIAQQVQHILAYDALTIWLPSIGSTAEVSKKWSMAFGYPTTAEPDFGLPLSEFSFGPNLLTAQPIVIDDFAMSTAQYVGDRLILNHFGRAAVIVPIQAAARVLGGLVLISRMPGFYHAEDASLIEPVAGLVALALEHQRLDQQAWALAVVEERNRLAREIHDTLAHSLTGIIINLEALKPYATRRSQTDADVLAETEGLARNALAEARRSVLGLHPTPLQHQTLREALMPELAGLAKRAGLVTQFYLQGVERSLVPDVAIALFRVAQEAFHNIEKHAAARHVILGLTFEADAVVLTVEDDGIGFALATAIPQATGGFGLLSMAARAHDLGGVCHVTSHPGHGTAVQATVPYVRPVIVAATPMRQANGPAQATAVASPIRVLVVDNHTTARQGIRRILDGQPDMQVVGEAVDGLAAIEQTGRLHPDVILLDLQMPRLSGVEALPRLRATHPAVEIVVLTMFDQDEQVFASLKAGARGYLLKDAAPEAIVAAVRAASRRESSLPPILTTRVVERFSVLAQQEADPDALTGREQEMLDYMAKGLPYKAIAARLHVTTHTVQYHVTHILQKLHVGNRGEAVAAARQRGLL